MPALNKVMLIGNLTRDPMLKQLPSNTTLAEFGLAVNRKYKNAAGEDKEDTCFIDCTAFGKQAEVINQFCRKGKLLYVEGRLKYDAWDDKQGLGRRSKISLVVEQFQFLGGRDESQHPGRPDERPHAPGRPAKTSAEQPFGEEQMFQEADIPF